MGLFYTGKGDKGTSQIGKKKVPKDSPVIKVLGDLDELNSLIGATKSSIKEEELRQKLQNVQETLFIIQARVAWIMSPEYETKQLAEKKVTELEKEIDVIEEKIKPERGFIISGSDPIAAQLDYLRAVSRRAELSIDILHRKNELPQEILAYLNRLSSYFYALARNEIHERKIKEPRPTYE